MTPQSMQGWGKLASGPGPQEDKLDEGVLRVPQAPGTLGGGTHTHLRKGPQASHRALRLTRAPSQHLGGPGENSCDRF